MPPKSKRTTMLRNAGLVVAVLAGAGCNNDSGTDTGSMTQRQDAALKDPFSYGPTTPANKTPEPVIKPRDHSLKGDWDSFWNP